MGPATDVAASAPSLTDINDLDARVGRVENSVVQLSTDLKNTNHLLEGVARQIQNLFERQRPNWTLLIMAAGLFITVGGLAVAPLYREADHQNKQIEKLQDEISSGKDREIDRLHRKLERYESAP